MVPSKKSRKMTARSKELVFDGVLPDQATTAWRPAAGERYPSPNDGELVVFKDFFHCGFGLPAHPFFRKLLMYYVISLIHLNTNSILHLSIFINLCEAYLGIEPHFNLFRYLFHLKSLSRAKIVGATYLVLRDGKAAEYKPVLLSTSNKGWKVKWFYTENIELGLSGDIDSKPKTNPNWSVRPSDDEMVQVEELLDLLARVNINGVECTQNFIGRRIQPCKERSHLAYEYRQEDFVREAPEMIDNDEINC
jgi:hypothetical protein